MRRLPFHSPLEIAELAKRLNVMQVPHTKRRMQELIKREGWDNSPLSRDRVGRGGGREYHPDLWPDFLLNAYLADEQKKQIQIDAQNAQAAQRAELELLGNTELNARQRTVMEARAAIVNSVKAREIEAGETQGQAVNYLIEKAKVDAKLGNLANKANDRAGQNRTLSRAVVYRWIKVHSEHGVHGLAPKVTKDTHSFPSWFPQFMSYYAKPQAPTITDALDNLRYEGRLNDVPSYDQVRRCLKKLDKVKGTQARHRGREGSLALKARHAYVVRKTDDLLPTSVYTADGKTFDAEVQHPIHGRPYKPEITSILDVYSRKCVGWSVGLAENSQDVREALRHACEQHGIPAIFYVDRGKGFKNNSLDNKLTGFCARLGITKMHSLPYNSQARGIIERFNGSVHNPLAKQFDSYLGADMDRQAAQKFHKQSRKDLKEFGTSNVLPTIAEFVEALQAKIDKYNASNHRGLEYRDNAGRKHEITPDQMWQRAVDKGFEPVGILPHEGDDLFRPTEKRMTRRGMVSFINQDYFDHALVPYDGTYVLVGYDFHDGSKVWCREIETINGEEEPGRLICVARFEANATAYIPASMAQRASENRAKSRERRLQVHLDEVHAEANPNRFLEQSAQEPISIDMGQPPRPTPVTIEAVVDEKSDPSRLISSATATNSKIKIVGDRPTFDDDHSYAAWCCENPEKLLEKDRSLLQQLVRSSSDREYLRINGVDLEAVEKLVRSVA
jgi:putative transposase